MTATTADEERSQNSPAIAVDPTDSRFVALANRLDGPQFSCALNVSGDGGHSWVPAMAVTALPEGAASCYAPEIAFDRKGVLYYAFIGLRSPGNTPMGVFLTTSTDRRTFTPPRQVLGDGRFMVRMVIDPDEGEHGRLHLVWLEARAPVQFGGLEPVHNPILAAYSDDGGTTFSTPVEVGDPRRELVVAPSVALGPDGALHVAYYDLEEDRRDYQGLDGPTWDGTWTVAVATSTDGGKTFSRHTAAATGLVPPERVMLIFTMPPPAIAADSEGGVWVSWWDGRNGDWDVFVAASGDGAQSFGSARRLNDDAEGNGRHQYMPRLSVAPNGRIDVIFYDRRDDPKNVYNTVTYTFSSDGGRTFAPNTRVTSESFSSRTGQAYRVRSAKGLVEFGSRLALAPTPGGVLAAWTDTRNVRVENVHQDIFSAEIVVPGTVSARSPSSNWPVVLGGVGVAAALAAGLAWGARRRRRLKTDPVPTAHS